MLKTMLLIAAAMTVSAPALAQAAKPTANAPTAPRTKYAPKPQSRAEIEAQVNKVLANPKLPPEVRARIQARFEAWKKLQPAK